MGQIEIKPITLFFLVAAISCGNTQGEFIATGTIYNQAPNISSASPPTPESSSSSVKNHAPPCAYANTECEKSCNNTDTSSGCSYNCECIDGNMQCEVICPLGKCPPKALQDFTCKTTKETYCAYLVGSCLCDEKNSKKWK